MENISKALLIAAGMLLTVLLVSMVIMFYNRISSFYEQQHEFTVIEQTEKFNAQFEAYHKDGIRGNELISFMNKVINYNATESYFEDKSYKRIGVTIDLVDDDIINKYFVINPDEDETIDSTYKNNYLRKKITNLNPTGSNWENDKKLIDITNTSADLCSFDEKFPKINNMTDRKLQQLASNAHNIVVSEKKDDSASRTARFKRAILIEDILGISVGSSASDDIKIDNSTGETSNDTSSKDYIEKIKKITSKYHQYMQFKRACFNCTKMEYDVSTNRVIAMEFQVQTDNDGNVVFD